MIHPPRPDQLQGLVCQYYLRSAPESGDIQVILADKKHRTRKSHGIAISVRDAVEAIGRKSGGNDFKDSQRWI